MSDSANILIVDDLADNAILLKKILRADGHHTHIVDNGLAALEYVQERACDLILLDVMMPGMDGLEVTRRLKADPERRYIPILLVTAKADLPSVVEGLDAGADDYLTKPVERQELLARVRSALRVHALQKQLLTTQQELEQKNEALEESYKALLQRTREKETLQSEVGDLRRKVAEGNRLGDIIGRSQAMQRVFDQIRLVAVRDATVLIRGETGTGKELVARALHLESPRAEGPFVALNCGAVPEGLLESELFGHEKGAFTGASGQRAGRFERAAGGTLFLDEVGDVPMAMQVRLLRVLQEREFERVGGSTTIKADVRIIAATHKDLEASVREGDFRQDLYYRLNVIPIPIPPLRERHGDIPYLARHLLEKASKSYDLTTPEIGQRAMEQLMAYTWPGNVRELENVLERALILSGGGRLDQVEIPGLAGFAVGEGSVSGAAGGVTGDGSPRPGAPGGVSSASDTFVPELELPFKIWKNQLLAHHERNYILAALRRCGGSMAAAGRETGVDAKTFSRKIREYGIARSEYQTADGEQDSESGVV